MEESKQYVESEEGSPIQDARKSYVKASVRETSIPRAQDDTYIWKARESYNTAELNDIRGSRDIQM